MCAVYMSLLALRRVSFWRLWVWDSVGWAAVGWVHVVVRQRRVHGVLQLLDAGFASGFIGCACTLLMAMWFRRLCKVSFSTACVGARVSSLHYRHAGMLCMGICVAFVCRRPYLVANTLACSSASRQIRPWRACCTRVCVCVAVCRQGSCRVVLCVFSLSFRSATLFCWVFLAASVDCWCFSRVGFLRSFVP